MPNMDGFDLRDAPPFDVYKWSDYPEVNAAVDALIADVEGLYQLQGKQFREKRKAQRYIKVLVIGLWAAVKLGPVAWRSISRNQAEYRSGRENRYRKIHFKARMLVLLDDLISLGYVEEKRGFQDRATGIGYKTRIQATPALIQMIDRHGVAELARQVGDVNILAPLSISPETGLAIEPKETIRLKDLDGNLIDYRESRQTKEMRKNLSTINAMIQKAKITLMLDNDQFETMHGTGRNIDFTQKSLHRVFNGSFDLGGRFYGGWWEGVPRDLRPYIHINHQSIVELDYSGHHVRMLYAQEGLKMPDDPYDLDGIDRDDQKAAVMIILNANDDSKALRAIASEGIKDGRELLERLKVRHEPIAKYFHSGVGLKLQNKDAQIAERLMLQMINRSNATILPIHDSFLVSKGYEQELLEAMNDAFKIDYGQAASVKAKKTALELQAEDCDPEDEDRVFKIMNKTNHFDLEQHFNRYEIYYRVFGN